MSADDYLYITRENDVLHRFASTYYIGETPKDTPLPPEEDIVAREQERALYHGETLEEAVKFAQRWCQDNVCEYGIFFEAR